MNIVSSCFRKWRWILALLALTLFAFVVRSYYVTAALVVGPVRGDAIQYYAYAWNLAHHGVFAMDAPGATVVTPDSYRDPGYPMFLAGWMKLFANWDQWYPAVLFNQALLGALTVTLTSVLGRHWLSARWALIAGLLTALWPHAITSTGYLLSETLFGFLCVLSLTLVATALSRASARLMVAAGMSLGLAALTNAILLPFGPLLAVFLAWRKLASRKLCVALAVGAIVLPCGWAFRNSQVASPHGDASSLARALQNLEQGSRPDFQLAWRNAALGDGKVKIAAGAVLRETDEEYRLMRTSPALAAKAMLGRFGEHPLRYAAWYLIQKPYLVWGWDIQIGQGDIYIFPVANSPFQTMRAWIALEVIAYALNPLFPLLALSALFFFGSRRESSGFQEVRGRVALIATFVLCIFATLIYTALQAEPRYGIPFRSFEMLLVATTLSGLTAKWRRRHA